MIPRKPLIVLILLLSSTAVFALFADTFRMLDHDEFLSLHTDDQPSAAQVVRVQLQHPISLDPPTYHLLSHGAMQVFGPGPLALRLPAVLGFLLMQACVYLFLLRIANWQVAAIGALLPVLTASFFMSLEGRPYGLLLGATALALVSWQTLARSEAPHIGASILLAVSLLTGVTAHFFGFLVVLPILAAEVVRTMRRRRLDWRVLLPLAAALAGFALILPFRKAVQVYQTHYWSESHVAFSGLARTFGDLTLDGGGQGLHLVLGLAVVLLLVLCAMRVFTRLVRGVGSMTPGEFAGVVICAAMPAIAWAVGTVVTHTFQARYGIQGCIGIAIFVALGGSTLLGSAKYYRAALAILGLCAGLFVAHHSYRALRDRHKVQLGFVPSEPVNTFLTQTGNTPIYLQNNDAFFQDSYYAPSQAAHRLRLLYDGGEEIRFRHSDTGAITARNLGEISPLQVTALPAFCDGRPHLLLTYSNNWEWIGDELITQKAAVQPIGSLMGGRLERVTCTMGQ